MAKFQNTTLENFNQTLLNDSSLCTLSTCPSVLDGVHLAHLTYLPTVAGNALYAAIFGVLIVTQIILGIRYRTWGYMIGMFFGLLCEIIGYAGRIMMHSNPFVDANFIMYLCCLTIGPAFLSASIYLCLARIVVIYSRGAARFKPQTYTYIFISCDFFSLVLQGAGGGLASTTNTSSGVTSGKDIMVAGLCFQVVSLAVFSLFCLDLFLRYRRLSEESFNPDFIDLRRSRKLALWFWTLAGATLFIFIRSCFRVAELCQGFDSSLANSQITFMILEGAMIVLATSLLTGLHPGVAVGKEYWAMADWAAGLQKQEKGAHA